MFCCRNHHLWSFGRNLAGLWIRVDAWDGQAEGSPRLRASAVAKLLRVFVLRSESKHFQSHPDVRTLQSWAFLGQFSQTTYLYRVLAGTHFWKPHARNWIETGDASAGSRHVVRHRRGRAAVRSDLEADGSQECTCAELLSNLRYVFFSDLNERANKSTLS